MRSSYLAAAILSIILSAQLIAPSSAHLNTSALRTALQSSNLTIKEINPVVNEGNSIKLTAVDAAGQEATGVLFESGSPDIAAADPQTGTVRGIRRGFATITARRGSESVSTFVVVARVTTSSGAKVPGDTKTDSGGRIYLSDPLGSVILRKDAFASGAIVFAGSKGVNGKRDGKRTDALFAGPTAVAVDNSARGGVYIADTLNHSIRKVDYQDEVRTMLGTGSPGINNDDVTPFARAAFNGLRGIAADAGGNLYIADTDNHAIYYADFVKNEVRLLAGAPGASGKADGKGRTARFFRPTSISVSPDGQSIAVADTGNNRVRLITRDGSVTTISSSSQSSGISTKNFLIAGQAIGEIVFDAPQSVGFDGTGNIYVVDGMGPKLVVFPANRQPQVFPLAQPGVSFNQAASLAVKGIQTFVLDANAPTDAEAVKVVTVGGPTISAISRDRVRLEGGEEVIVTGGNFAPETQIALGDSTVTDLTVESATLIRFIAPKQTVPGDRTVTVRTRGGVAQRKISVLSKSISEIADGEITTIAGGVPFLGDGGLASDPSTALSAAGVVADGAGNLFIADTFNNRIRRIDASTGIITTAAGNGSQSFGGDGGLAQGAGMFAPNSIAVDGSGNIFIADTENHRIRRVDGATGIMATVAGRGDAAFKGDGGRAVEASLSAPTSAAMDAAGNLFILDSLNSRIRRIDAAGVISTIAGTGKFEFGGDGGLAVNASINSPLGGAIAFDKEGNLLIADETNNRIRRIDANTGIITTIAGSGAAGFSGDGGLAETALLKSPNGICIDGAGNILIADSGNNRIRLIDSNGIISTIAGNGDENFGGDGGPALNAGIGFPKGIAADGAGNIFIADFLNNRVRRVDALTGAIVTIAGFGEDEFSGDGGPATSAELDPRSIAEDREGNIYVADELNNRIRKIDAATGIVVTIAGNGSDVFSGDGGPAVDAGIDPRSIIVDGAGNILIADSRNNRVRKIDAATGIISTIAGTGGRSFGGDGGPAVGASFSGPNGIAIDRSGNILIADTLNCRIRKIDAQTGIIDTIAGTGDRGYGGDGDRAEKAKLLLPDAIAADAGGNLYIADSGNGRIRRMDAVTGFISTVAGSGLPNYSGDGGAAASAGMDAAGLALDGAGNLFIVDRLNNRIRKVEAATGIINTIAGKGDGIYSGDGGSAQAAGLNIPTGAIFDKDGNLLIADFGNDAVRIIKGAGKTQSPQPFINSASFEKSRLTINGSGFTVFGANVSVKGKDVSRFIISQTDARIILKGNKKKLNLVKERNQIAVTVNGAVSNTFLLDP